MAAKNTSYCPRTGTATHAATCFREEQNGCGRVEHVHIDSCFTSSGKRKCPYAKIHTHGAGCVSRVGPLCGGT